MSKLYYTPPEQIIFDEIKEASIEIWKTYNDKYDYATNEINRIKDLENVLDNWSVMVSMFDVNNQSKLATALSDEARQAVYDRLADGGISDYFNPFKS